jgi:GT2 family glycosyltransferase
MQPDLTLSVISAGSLDLLLPCLRSVFDNTHTISLEVYLVDNASAEGIAEAVQAEHEGIQILRNECRLGFSTNNNLVLGRGQGRYLMLLNDDTLVLEGALDRMVEFMDAHPQAGAVGGFLLNADGSFQPAYGYFPHPVLEAWWPATNWSHWFVGNRDRPFEVDTVCGAALLVRRQVIAEVGVLDTAFDPIYSEEVDWCFRIKGAGWKIYALPQARIVHYGSQTMNQVVPRKYELLLAHKMRFFHKHAGERAASIYGLALRLSTAFKLAWWSAASLLPFKRQARIERRQLHRHLMKQIPFLAPALSAAPEPKSDRPQDSPRS